MAIKHIEFEISKRGEKNNPNNDLWTVFGADDEGIPENVLDDMLRAEANIIAAEERKNADTMLDVEGYSKKITRDAIKVGSPYTRRISGDKKRLIQVHIPGTREGGITKSSVAYINEYGRGYKTKSRMTARHFVKKAIEAKEEEAQDAAEKIFDEWLEKIID